MGVFFFFARSTWVFSFGTFLTTNSAYLPNSMPIPAFISHFQKKRKEKKVPILILRSLFYISTDHILNKISFKTNLGKNLTKSSYIFILSVNFGNLTAGLYVLIGKKYLI